MSKSTPHNVLFKSFEILSKIIITTKGVINKNCPAKPIALFRKQINHSVLRKNANSVIHSRNQYASHAPRSTFNLLQQHSLHSVSVFSLPHCVRAKKPPSLPVNSSIHQIATSFLCKKMYHRNSEFNLMFPSRKSRTKKPLFNTPTIESNKKHKKLEIRLPSSRNYKSTGPI